MPEFGLTFLAVFVLSSETMAAMIGDFVGGENFSVQCPLVGTDIAYDGQNLWYSMDGESLINQIAVI